MTPRPLPDRRSMGLPLQRLKGWVCIWRTAVGTTGPCSVRLADLCREDEVSRWWRALAGRAGAAGDGGGGGGGGGCPGGGGGGGGGPGGGGGGRGPTGGGGGGGRGGG